LSARRALFERLIDDAGLFPPARKDMARAADDHRAAEEGPHEWMLGRFLCPASRLEELRPLAAPDWTIGVVSDRGWEEDLAAALEFGADCLELREPGPEAWDRLAEAPITVFVEGPDDMEVLRQLGLGAKIRCGGLDAAAFPSNAAVAEFIAECKRLELPFKATAGLHHPFRTRDEEIGVLQHGFLNLLAAAILDVPESRLEELIAAPGSSFVVHRDYMRWHGFEADEGLVRLGRTRFTAYGSCSFDEPVDDLLAEGILPPVAPVA
jgi:hypothetical protein